MGKRKDKKVLDIEITILNEPSQKAMFQLMETLNKVHLEKSNKLS